MRGLKQRHVKQWLPSSQQKQLVLITGARQTGKTTLVKACYPSLPYLNLDSIEYREKLQSISTQRWAKDVGVSIIDEAQKEPSLFEKIKYAYDAGDLPFSVLLGSSQLLLLKKIRESLAGRITIFELFPLTLAEIYTGNSRNLNPPLFDQLLQTKHLNQVLASQSSILLNETAANKRAAQDYMLAYGGMPALLHLLTHEEKIRWLKDYELTYLERDLADLARLSDLQPFRKLQKLAALRNACLLNYSELARDASISVDTARRYLEYLKLSYQITLLQPYHRNLTSTVIKTPKLYWLDIGIWRSLTGITGIISGEMFETFVIGECIKWIKTARRHAVELFFYRTRSGLEVDLLLETHQGIIGIQIKNRSKTIVSDTKALKELSYQLKKEWLGGMVIYKGEAIIKIAEPNIWAIPAWRLLT